MNTMSFPSSVSLYLKLVLAPLLKFHKHLMVEIQTARSEFEEVIIASIVSQAYVLFFRVGMC